MAKTGTVTVAGKSLACHHCGHATFEVRPYYLTSMLFVGGAVAAMCTACHFVHTFRQRADVQVG